MSVTSPSESTELLKVPDSLREQLASFRSRVWTTKMAEAVAVAIAGVLIAFLTVFLVDRFYDTPQSIRLGIFSVTLAICLIVPWALHRWVWRHRRLDQLAKLLRVREPNVGDQLLGVIELSESDSEQARSRTLCAAAIEQVASSASKRDLNQAAPRSRIRFWGSLVAVSACVAIGLGAVAGPAAKNAWARLAAPWADTPRYTFTMIDELPANIVVPHGETVSMQVHLREESKWEPSSASIKMPGLSENVVSLDGRTYTFEIPPRI